MKPISLRQTADHYIMGGDESEYCEYATASVTWYKPKKANQTKQKLGEVETRQNRVYTKYKPGKLETGQTRDQANSKLGKLETKQTRNQASKEPDNIETRKNINQTNQTLGKLETRYNRKPGTLKTRQTENHDIKYLLTFFSRMKIRQTKTKKLTFAQKL